MAVTTCPVQVEVAPRLAPQFGTLKQAQPVKDEQGAQLAFDVE